MKEVKANSTSGIAVPEAAVVNEQEAQGIMIEGLGIVGESTMPLVNQEDEDEGKGNYCVVLHDFVSGAKGTGYVKGRVVRASKLVNGFEDDKQAAKESLGRLFSLRAIRLATDEEAQHKFVAVTAESESPSVQEAREKLMAVERENEALRIQLAAASTARQSATPGDSLPEF